MPLITQRDFETSIGQEKIVRTIHNLELKVHALNQELSLLVQRVQALERDTGVHNTVQSDL